VEQSDRLRRVELVLVVAWIELELARRKALLEDEPVTNGQVDQTLSELQDIANGLHAHLKKAADLSFARNLVDVLRDRRTELAALQPRRAITAARFHAIALDVKMNIASLVQSSQLQSTLNNLAPRPKK